MTTKLPNTIAITIPRDMPSSPSVVGGAMGAGDMNGGDDGGKEGVGDACDGGGDGNRRGGTDGGGVRSVGFVGGDWQIWHVG